MVVDLQRVKSYDPHSQLVYLVCFYIMIFNLTLSHIPLNNLPEIQRQTALIHTDITAWKKANTFQTYLGVGADIWSFVKCALLGLALLDDLGVLPLGGGINWKGSKTRIWFKSQQKVPHLFAISKGELNKLSNDIMGG